MWRPKNKAIFGIFFQLGISIWNFVDLFIYIWKKSSFFVGKNIDSIKRDAAVLQKRLKNCFP